MLFVNITGCFKVYNNNEVRNNYEKDNDFVGVADDNVYKWLCCTRCTERRD